jgi:glycosyltransferase involved in cell wall biosynthesis
MRAKGSVTVRGGGAIAHQQGAGETVSYSAIPAVDSARPAASLLSADMQVAGYFAGVMGTGEQGRQLLQALRYQGIDVSVTTIHPDSVPEDEQLTPGFDASESASTNSFPDFNLLCANADVVPNVAAELGDAFFRDRYTIGFWAWEVSAFPAEFSPAFTHLDEVWVGTRHTRDAVSAASTVPVVMIPQPVSLPDDAGSAQPPAGLPDGFRFLFAFDYLSVFERKNPLATIDAFTRAFPHGSGSSLIIKSLNHDHNPEAHGRLLAAASAQPDVHVIERRLSLGERNGLMNAADCYVSLHRAEGFGYTLAESMWLGTPVIATGYSGNVDFMTPNNSYLVDHRLVPIGAGNEPYPPDGVWAEPDVEHAARLMREVFEHRDEAARRVQRAAADIRSNNGLHATGRAMAERLTVLSQIPRKPRAKQQRERDDKLGELIRSGPVPPGQPRFGTPQLAARKALLRLLKPVTVHQRLVEEQLLRRIEQLEAELDELRSTRRDQRS